MKDKSNGELAFLGSLLKCNNGKIFFVLAFRRPIHTDQYLHHSSHHQTSCKESALPSFFSGAYSITTNEDDLTKRKTRMKEVVKENGYQKSIFKIFKRISNNHSLC